MLLDIWTDTKDFFTPVVDFFKDTWENIENFLLQYMSKDVLNILIFGILIAIILIIVLAIMNRD